MNTTVDLTPTWGEIGNMYARFAECGEVRVIRAMRPDVARALAAAQALQAIALTLTHAQGDLVAKTITVELNKQGY